MFTSGAQKSWHIKVQAPKQQLLKIVDRSYKPTGNILSIVIIYHLYENEVQLTFGLMEAKFIVVVGPNQ